MAQTEYVQTQIQQIFSGRVRAWNKIAGSRVSGSIDIIYGGASRQALRLQEGQRGHAGSVLADPRVVEHAQPRARRQRVTRRADAAVRAAHRQAARIRGPQFGDRIHDPQHDRHATPGRAVPYFLRAAMAASAVFTRSGPMVAFHLSYTGRVALAKASRSAGVSCALAGTAAALWSCAVRAV